MNANGDTITLDAKGFGTLADASPVTGVNHTLADYYSARDTLDHLRGNLCKRLFQELLWRREMCCE